MKILEDGVLRDMTDEELQQCADAGEDDDCVSSGDDNALNEFFSGLASGETNSIAKIRELARVFLEKTGV